MGVAKGGHVGGGFQGSEGNPKKKEIQVEGDAPSGGPIFKSKQSSSEGSVGLLASYMRRWKGRSARKSKFLKQLAVSGEGGSEDCLAGNRWVTRGES